MRGGIEEQQEVGKKKRRGRRRMVEHEGTPPELDLRYLNRQLSSSQQGDQNSVENNNNNLQNYLFCKIKGETISVVADGNNPKKCSAVFSEGRRKSGRLTTVVKV